MRLNIKYIFLFSIVFNIISCKPAHFFKTKTSSNTIDNSYPNNAQVDSLIQPYKTKLNEEMNEVLVISAEEFPKESGKAETKLGNLVADLSFEIANEMYKPTDGHHIDFCLLNFGGLRTSLPKGKITRGKIFELMPFENELVVITINHNNYNSLIEYLRKSGGQPISGLISLYFGKEENQIVEEWEHRINVNILTTNYLANGGDNMKFFLNPIKYEKVGIKLRDAIIQYCITQNKKGKQLVGKIDGRITFEE